MMDATACFRYASLSLAVFACVWQIGACLECYQCNSLRHPSGCADPFSKQTFNESLHGVSPTPTSTDASTETPDPSPLGIVNCTSKFNACYKRVTVRKSSSRETNSYQVVFTMVTRGCTTIDDDNDSCEDNDSGSTSSVSCYCKTDLCNHAVVTSSVITTSLVLPLITFFLSLG